MTAYGDATKNYYGLANIYCAILGGIDLVGLVWGIEQLNRDAIIFYFLLVSTELFSALKFNFKKIKYITLVSMLLIYLLGFVLSIYRLIHIYNEKALELNLRFIAILCFAVLISKTFKFIKSGRKTIP